MRGEKLKSNFIPLHHGIIYVTLKAPHNVGALKSIFKNYYRTVKNLKLCSVNFETHARGQYG